MISGVVKAIQAYQAANEGATIAQAALNLVMNANPIGIVITAVAALVTAIVALWNTNEDFRNAIISAWGKIKDTISSAVKAISAFSRKRFPMRSSPLLAGLQVFRTNSKILGLILFAVFGTASNQ